MSYPNSKTRRGRVQEGGTVSPTIMANNNELYVIEPSVLRMVRTEDGKRLRKSYEAHEIDFGFNEYRKAEIRTDGLSNTLSTVQKDNLVVEPTPFRVRKLTPKECWRLMGFDDDSFQRAEQVNSNSQLYKQAGNSIVVSVLEAIFGEMLP